MAFGQASGPPAAVQQLNRLAELLAERGFDSFKEARHPFGLTQRQASGKFSGGEASELIERLEAESVVWPSHFHRPLVAPPPKSLLSQLQPNQRAEQAAASQAGPQARPKGTAPGKVPGKVPTQLR